MQVFRAVRHLSVCIECPPARVYAFASDPRNLPLWARGLGGAIELVDGDWIADSPMGKVKVRFVEANQLGVLDHEVVLPSGASVYNPLRVVANAEGSEVIFTLFQRPEMSEQELGRDAEAVQRDLEMLRSLLQ